MKAIANEELRGRWPKGPLPNPNISQRGKAATKTGLPQKIAEIAKTRVLLFAFLAFLGGKNPRGPGQN